MSKIVDDIADKVCYASTMKIGPEKIRGTEALEEQSPRAIFMPERGEDRMGRKNRPAKIRKRSLPDVTRIQPPKRMDIWYAHLRENTGTSVQEGSRPVLVISNDLANKNSDVVTVIPLTSQMKRVEMPTHCIIHDLLDSDSVVLAEQITAIPKWRLHKKLCSCTDEMQISEIEKAVRVQLGLEDKTNE